MQQLLHGVRAELRSPLRSRSCWARRCGRCSAESLRNRRRWRRLERRQVDAAEVKTQLLVDAGLGLVTQLTLERDGRTVLAHAPARVLAQVAGHVLVLTALGHDQVQLVRYFRGRIEVYRARVDARRDRR